MRYFNYIYRNIKLKVMIVVVIIVGIVLYFVGTNLKKAAFKRSLINTFYYLSTSDGHDDERRRVCKFYHDRYTDGTHKIKIDISDANPMVFNLLSEPTEIGKTIMFELSSIDNSTKGIDLMMLDNSAYIKFPDGTMINFRS